MKRTDIKKRPLTDTTIENLEPQKTLYREKDSHNLYLQVKPTGAKSWVMRYKKANGQWSWHGLGAYPLIKGARARQLYSEKLTKLADGTDLTEKPTTAKTFEAIALEWYNEPAIQKLADSYKDKILQRLQVHIFPIVGNKPINDIDRQLWLKLFKQIQSKTSIKTGKPILETARRTLEICQRIYRFAIVNEFIDTSPLDYLHERLQKPTHENMAHVGIDELPKLLTDIQSIQSDMTRIGLLLLAHLFLRPNEVLNAKWCEIDLHNGLWQIPPERMKAKRPHTIPLSRQVIELLTMLHAITGNTGVLFPHKASTPANAHQRFRKALNDKGYKSKQTLHGFRHIASTILNNHTDNGQKFDERVIETALAHKVQGVKGVYNKADYLDDRKVLNQWYSNFLNNLLKC